MSESKQVTMAKLIAELQEQLPAMLAKQKIDAQLHREKYIQCIKAGFNETEALELCKSVWGQE